MRCPECEAIEALLFEPTLFWLHLPTVDVLDKLKQAYASHEPPLRSDHDHHAALLVPRAQVGRFIDTLSATLNGQELAGIRLITTPGKDPGIEDLGRVLDGKVFVNRYRGREITDALAAGRYTSWFQPIRAAQAPEDAKPFAREALFRLWDAAGHLIPPARAFLQADLSGQLFTLDLLARRCAVETAARAGFAGNLFINFNPSSIYDPAYCLRTTAATIAELGLRPENIVFELTETHRARDMEHLKQILHFYRDAGFGVAIDDMGSGWAGLNLLHELRPDYMKLDMALIRDIDRDRFKQSIVVHLFETARRNGIQSLAEGVETEAEADWLRAAGADLLQGFLFGRPEPVADAGD
ncbi:EAL domain-containing protein [uncultured Thiohalocapsa sp.]|uniref:EAL domain-containing protein n=1 Tax=uncultured Thiohalocapsa sp. TaxID=768990 RepID=UPI0025D0AB6B|nr:EAL domain-containing protein [uncultured Thiohalocapsa sp.]